MMMMMMMIMGVEEDLAIGQPCASEQFSRLMDGGKGTDRLMVTVRSLRSTVRGSVCYEVECHNALIVCIRHNTGINGG